MNYVFFITPIAGIKSFIETLNNSTNPMLIQSNKIFCKIIILYFIHNVIFCNNLTVTRTDYRLKVSTM